MLFRSLAHQILLLPFTIGFLTSLWHLLFASEKEGRSVWWSPRRALWLILLFEILFVLLFLYECHHFAPLGYRLHPLLALAIFIPLLISLAGLALKPLVKGRWIFGVVLVAYVAGMVLAIASFPLNYLRSDMLPVIIHSSWYQARTKYSVSGMTNDPLGALGNES